ncbi:MAG TPA: hypothetical protein VN813_09270 [Luteibacter sp.]|nr:hypothetical protein [Luteibacter sp.]
MTSARGISFDLRPSATLTRLVVAIVVLATAAPLVTGMPWHVRWLMAVAIGAHGAWRVRAFRRPAAASLAWTTDDVWTVTLPGGRVKPASLVASRRFGTAVFLQLRWRGGAGHVALLEDNTPADALRLLRARLSSMAPP